MTNLVAYGWDDALAARVGDLDQLDGRVGRVIRVERGECDVITGEEIERVASDSLRAQDDLAPVTGDWVVVGDDPDTGPVIDRIIERDHVLARRDPAERDAEQVLVANIDAVLIVHGLDRPLPPGRLERYLVVAWDSDTEPVVVLTKSDIHDAERTSALIEAIAPGVRQICVDSIGGQGLDEVAAFIGVGRTIALLGESGAGKSTLVNALAGEERQEIGEVRSGDSKGRHTTVTRDLVLLPTGALIVDTPGIRAVGLWEAEEALHRVFDDVEELSESCRFGDCRHGAEPDCAVTGALDPARIERYAALRDELERQRDRQVARERKPKGRPGRRR